jgi:serine/threonine-protein kinase
MKYCPKCQRQYGFTQRLCPADGELLSLPDPYYLVGHTLMEKYRIEALVGIGGMGAVYSARHLAINRRVAFKILLPNLALGNESMLDLFQREAETAGQLNHDNIVDVYDAGRTPNGIAYIVMEWVEGPTLEEELIQEKPFSFERAAEITRQVAAALDHAHARRIVHRDLKPSNIMLVHRENGDELVKVVDFGIAKVISETTLAPVSRVIGTPHYASPEQFRPGAHLDGRADIYSLGVILYQMLTAHLPFNADEPIDLVRMHRTSNPPSLRLYRADVPASIEQLVMRMLAKEPQFRPQAATEAAELFERVVKSPELAKTPFVFGLETNQGGRAMTDEMDFPGVIDTNLLAPTLRVAEGVGGVPDRLKIEYGIERPSDIKSTEPRGHQSAPTTAGAAGKQNKNVRRRISILAGILILLFSGALFYPDFKRVLFALSNGNSNPAPATVDLLSYSVEITTDKCGRGVRTAGDQPIKSGQFFRFHFIPRERGYLYLIAPDDKNTPNALLTAQPHPETGVNTNFIEAGEDYSFPAGNCLGITENERMMAFTVIFSPTPLTTPSFLTALANRPLAASEQLEFNRWRQDFAINSTEIIPEISNQLTRVRRVNFEPRAADRPVVFDLLVKRQ